MDVYFIRHGETECNKKHIHQLPSTHLNERGIEQAHTVAELARELNPSLLVSSEYTRALETARIIGASVGLEAHSCPLFHEVRRPASLYGKSHFNPRTVRYVLASVLHRHDYHWWYEDAENMRDVRNRVKDALVFLKEEGKEHKSILVVSHTIFINLLVTYMCNDRLLSMRDLLPSLLHVTRLPNTGVIHVKFVGETGPGTCAWQLQDIRR